MRHSITALCTSYSKRFAEASYVDEVYPFIWKNFSDAGYITLYAEDSAKLGTFTYRLKVIYFLVF